MWEVFTYGQRPYRGDPFERTEKISDKKFVKFIKDGGTMSTPKQIFDEKEFSDNIEQFFLQFIRFRSIEYFYYY